MGRRFGGRFSPAREGSGSVEGPDGPPTGRGRGVPAGGLRARLLYLPAALALLSSLTAGALGLALGVAAAGLMSASAWLLAEGLKAEQAYRARRWARRPAVPRKILAALLAAAGVGVAAWNNAGQPGAAVLLAAVTAALFMAAFGIDPLSDRRPAGEQGEGDRFQRARVARAVTEAEGYLDEIEAALAPTADREVRRHVEAFLARARRLLRVVEDDPRDLVAARRFMGVYLRGARDAARKYAAIAARRPDPSARAGFLALLEDLERGFDARIERLMLDDNADLTIEIEVLRDRLQREGLGRQAAGHRRGAESGRSGDEA